MYTVFDNRNVSNTFGATECTFILLWHVCEEYWHKNKKLRPVVFKQVKCFLIQSLTLGDSKTRLELEFLKKDMYIPYAPVLQNIEISNMVSFIQFFFFWTGFCLVKHYCYFFILLYLAKISAKI